MMFTAWRSLTQQEYNETVWQMRGYHMEIIEESKAIAYFSTHKFICTELERTSHLTCPQYKRNVLTKVVRVAAPQVH